MPDYMPSNTWSYDEEVENEEVEEVFDDYEEEDDTYLDDEVIQTFGRSDLDEVIQTTERPVVASDVLINGNTYLIQAGDVFTVNRDHSDWNWLADPTYGELRAYYSAEYSRPFFSDIVTFRVDGYPYHGRNDCHSVLAAEITSIQGKKRDVKVSGFARWLVK